MTSIVLVPPENKNPDETKRIKLTFDEYLYYDDRTDNLHELVRGNLVTMASPTVLHINICLFLLYLLQNELGEMELMSLAVNEVGVRTLDDTVRIPDVVVCDQKIWESARERKGAGVLFFEETPQLTIEVTSQNWRDDYILKKAEYAMISVPEYWIVDPRKNLIRICNLSEEGEYISTDYGLGEKIKSNLFPQINITVDEIMSPPIIENLIRVEKQATQELKSSLELERQRADEEKQRADKLAALLRENGISPDF